MSQLHTSSSYSAAQSYSTSASYLPPAAEAILDNHSDYPTPCLKPQSTPRSWMNKTIQHQSPKLAERLRSHKPAKRAGRWKKRLGSSIAGALTCTVMLAVMAVSLQFEQGLRDAFTQDLPEQISENMTNWENAVTLARPRKPVNG